MVRRRLYDGFEQIVWWFWADCMMVLSRLYNGSEQIVWWFGEDCMMVKRRFYNGFGRECMMVRRRLNKGSEKIKLGVRRRMVLSSIIFPFLCTGSRCMPVTEYNHWNPWLLELNCRSVGRTQPWVHILGFSNYPGVRSKILYPRIKWVNSGIPRIPPLSSICNVYCRYMSMYLHQYGIFCRGCPNDDWMNFKAKHRPWHGEEINFVKLEISTNINLPWDLSDVYAFYFTLSQIQLNTWVYSCWERV